MRKRLEWLLLVGISLSGCTPVFSPAEFGEPQSPHEEARMLAEAYGRTARTVAALPESFRTRERAARQGIEIVDVLREAAARAEPQAPDFHEPTVGIEVRVPAEGRGPAAVLAPLFRFPLAAPLEVRLDHFFLRVGNHHGEPLQTVPVGPLLSDLGRYVTSPASLTGTASLGERLSLVAPRDGRAIVDVQAAVIPVPMAWRAAVRPVILGSGSAPGAPRLLAVVATREGTSIQVIENRPEGRSALGTGQALDFNDGGERRAFAVDGRSVQTFIVLEVPLISGRVEVSGEGGPRLPGSAAGASESAERASRDSPGSSAAGAGGPFVEGYSQRIERDESRPLRATVFLMYPTLDGELSDADWEAIAGRLRALSSRPDSLGALLLPDTDASRAAP